MPCFLRSSLRHEDKKQLDYAAYLLSQVRRLLLAGHKKIWKVHLGKTPNACTCSLQTAHSVSEIPFCTRAWQATFNYSSQHVAFSVNTRRFLCESTWNHFTHMERLPECKSRILNDIRFWTLRLSTWANIPGAPPKPNSAFIEGRNATFGV